MLDLIYAAAADRTAWPRVLEAMADAVGAHVSALVLQDPVSGLGESVDVRTDPAMFRDYFGRFASGNVLLEASGRLRTGDVVTDRDMVPRERLETTDYYNEFLHAWDTEHMLGLTVWRDARRLGVLNLMRDARAGPYQDAQLALGRLWTPHLTRAFEISARLHAAERLAEDLVAALALLPWGAVIARPDGTVVHANPVAEALLRRSAGIAVRNGRLASTGLEDDARLRLALRDAGEGVGHSCRIGRAHAVSVLTAPLHGRPGWLGFGDRTILVALTEPAAPVGITPARLRALYGFTAAEASVVERLLAGDAPEQAAERLGVSRETVRTHLRRALHKAQVERRGDLIARLVREAGTIR